MVDMYFTNPLSIMGTNNSPLNMTWHQECSLSLILSENGASCPIRCFSIETSASRLQLLEYQMQCKCYRRYQSTERAVRTIQGHEVHPIASGQKAELLLERELLMCSSAMRIKPERIKPEYGLTVMKTISHCRPHLTNTKI